MVIKHIPAASVQSSNTSVTTETPLIWKTLNNSPVASSRTDDIWFFDKNTGWLVNSSGYVCKTDNAGECWHPMFYLCPGAPGKPYLRCLGWGSKQVGWFGAVTGISDKDIADNPNLYVDILLHQTKDGGESWTPVTNIPKESGVTPGGICGFYAVNEQVAYGSGSNDPGMPGPGIIKTTDGGANWELIDMKPWADNLIDIHFIDENTGFVVGGKIDKDCPIDYANYPPPRLIRYAQLKPVVLKTSDGGTTWTNMITDYTGFKCGEWGWKIQFVDERKLLGFVSLENFASAAILKTTDGGQTWTRHDVQDGCGNIINNDLEGIGFINENQGWVGGWGQSFTGLLNSYTKDGGKTWIPENNNPDVTGTLAKPNSDDRLRINRYRFVRDAETGNLIAGYCSGQQVYKLQIGCGSKKSAFASATSSSSSQDTTASASDTQTTSKQALANDKQAFSETQKTLKLPEQDFGLDYKKHSDGKLEIFYELPEGSKNVFIGLWNQLAFYVTTLVKTSVNEHGRKSVIWDGTDDDGNPAGDGVYICRLSVDGCEGSSKMVTFGQPR